MTDAADLRLARLTVQVGTLEARIAELRRALDGERADHARARRQLGALAGLLRGALDRGVLGGEYAGLARRQLVLLDDDRAEREGRHTATLVPARTVSGDPSPLL